MPDDDQENQLRALQDAWKTRLGRLRLGVEPIQDQVRLHLRVTRALTAVVTVLGILFFSLFTSFGRPDVGAILVCILIGPILVIAWYDYHKMKSNAEMFLREMGMRDSQQRPPNDE